MATTTPRIGLTKPDGTDLVDIAVLNTNFDKIDSNIASTKIQATKPSTANAGDLWWDSDTGTLYLYYVDANSSQWVAATSDPINIGVVASQAERDAQYPTPAQGMSVYRTDLGVTQRYYGLFNSSTNPGGRDTAGWYDTEKSIGLVPMKPTTVTIAGGTGSANAMGQVSFTNATNVDLDGVINSNYSHYKMIIDATYSINSNLYWWPRKNGVNDRPANYTTQFFRVGGTTFNSGQATGLDYGQLAQNASSQRNVCAVDLIGFGSLSLQRNTFSNSIGAAYGISILTTYMTATAATTGITLNLSGGTFTGTVAVYGYNEK